MTNEIIQKAKECKSAEEILALAKENGIEMTAEEAAENYAKLYGEGEITDDELDNVAGGLCGWKICRYNDCCEHFAPKDGLSDYEQMCLYCKYSGLLSNDQFKCTYDK